MSDRLEDIDLIEPSGTPEPQAPAALSALDPALGDNAPADNTPPAAEPDPLDQLLADYDQATTRPDPAAPEQQQQQTDPLQERALDHDGAVQAQARALFEGEQERQRLVQSFEQLCARGQERLPDWVPEGHFRSSLPAQSITDPRLEVALQAQHLNLSPVAIRVELDKVEAAIQRAAFDPTGSPQATATLRQWHWQLRVAMHARTILKQAEGEIIKKAKSRPPIDPDLTADRMAVVHAMGAAGGKVEPEPAPALGQLSDQELRNYTKQFGF